MTDTGEPKVTPASEVTNQEIERHFSKAEEGGNVDEPVRTLLVGGTKHGEFMNFPKGQTEWELVEANILAGIGYSTNDPRYIGNIYSLDQRLSQATGVQTFIHACLREPENGGRYPQLLRAETEAHAKYKKLYEREAETSLGLRDEVGDALCEIIDLKEEVSELTTNANEVRKALEVAAYALSQAEAHNDTTYEPAFNPPKEN